MPEEERDAKRPRTEGAFILEPEEEFLAKISGELVFGSCFGALYLFKLLMGPGMLECIRRNMSLIIPVVVVQGPVKCAFNVPRLRGQNSLDNFSKSRSPHYRYLAHFGVIRGVAALVKLSL
jgi:hypothetical protein